jgi:hypothetical protein
VTSKPRWRAAIAAARPAGPPPIMNTSRSHTLQNYRSKPVQNRIPTHRGQQPRRTWRWAASFGLPSRTTSTEGGRQVAVFSDNPRRRKLPIVKSRSHPGRLHLGAPVCAPSFQCLFVYNLSLPKRVDISCPCAGAPA